MKTAARHPEGCRFRSSSEKECRAPRKREIDHTAYSWKKLERYALGRGKICFGKRKDMLFDAGSYTFGLLELCFQTSGAMLWTLRSNAFRLLEQCSGPYGACLYIPIEQCSSTYGAMLCRVRSSALTGDK